jgi:hypothetical protein
MKTTHEILRDNHWTLEEYTQRMTVAEWRAVLAAEADRPMVKGQLRRLIAKRLGFGYVDVSKETL